MKWEGNYRSAYPNRQSRRKTVSKSVISDGGKLSLFGRHSYLSMVQIVPPYTDKDGDVIVGKAILHYVPAGIGKHTRIEYLAKIADEQS